MKGESDVVKLMPNLKEDAQKPLYIQLYEYIRQEIESARIEESEKLPSIRKMASDLSISKTTIESAYQQLIMEGYIYSSPKKGYYVSKIENNIFLNQNNHKNQMLFEKDCIEKDKELDKNIFDFNIWKKYTSRVLAYETQNLLTYGDKQGEYKLRREIVKYVYQSRGVICDFNQIVIGAGIQSLISILCVILKSIGYNTITFEEPGFEDPQQIFNDHKFNIKHIPLFDDGMDINILRKINPNICYVCPSHQFPTGTIMTINKRTQLLKWAYQNSSLIIEDDYDGQLRYCGKPIPALQGLSKGKNVIYLGSFSTLLIPSIRISYMVLPYNILEIYYKHKHKYNQTASKIDQLTLACFMEDGVFERHLKKIKRIYSQKNNFLLKELKDKLGNNLSIMGSESGIHMGVKIKTESDESALYGLCNKLNVEIKPIKKGNMYLLIFDKLKIPTK